PPRRGGRAAAAAALVRAADAAGRRRRARRRAGAAGRLALPRARPHAQGDRVAARDQAAAPGHPPAPPQPRAARPGGPIRLTDLLVDQVITVVPAGDVEAADSVTLLIRVPPGQLRLPW